MAPLPSLARLSLRPAPVGSDDDEPVIYRRFITDDDGNIIQGPLSGWNNNDAGPSNPPDDDEVEYQGQKTAEEVEEEKKRKAKAQGNFIELSDGEASPVTPAPKAVKTENKGKGKQPAKPDPMEKTPEEVAYERQQLDQVYTLKQQQAINQTTRATTAFLKGDVDNGLALLLQARDSGVRMKELKNRLDKLGGPLPGATGRYNPSDEPPLIRTLASSRAAAAGPPPQPVYRSELAEKMAEAQNNGMFKG